MANETALRTDTTLVINRLIDAPVALVWKAWTDPEHLVRWWGPRGFSNEVEEIAIREGGVWRFIMRGYDGKAYRNRIAYNEIKPMERIAYTIDDDGEGAGPAFEAVATFEPRGERTFLTMQLVFDSPEMRNAMVDFGAVEGGRSTLDKLEDEVASMADRPLGLTMTRVFDAPRELVWKCWIDPVHGTAWGPEGFTMEFLTGEPREGEPWRAKLTPADGGKPLLQGGVYRELREPERLVLTFGWEDEDGNIENETVISLDFEDHDGRTVMHFHQSGFPNERERDGHGIGWTEAFDAMAAHLETIQKQG